MKRFTGYFLIVLAFFLLASMGEGPTASAILSLVPSSTNVAHGEEVVIGLELDNPDALSFWRLAVQVDFDHTKLEVLDTSLGNWSPSVYTDRKIYDASHFAGFNTFSFHANNEVYNEAGSSLGTSTASHGAGQIYYDEQLMFGTLNSTGRFAEFTVRVLPGATSGDTVLSFDTDWGEEPPWEPGVLNDQLIDIVNIDSYQGTTLHIAPEPSTFLLLGAGIVSALVKRRRLK